MILTKLKEATRSQHDALESVVDIMNLTFTREEYTHLLIKFYRFYSTIEPNLPSAALRDAGLDLRERLKTPLLERDLEHLGKSKEIRALPTWGGVPATDSVERAFGSIYVMEGATLGGQVITRHLHKRLRVTPENGGAFFNSYGSKVGPMWKEFGAVLTAWAEKHPTSEPVIIESARGTFDSFRQCVEEMAAITATVS